MQKSQLKDVLVFGDNNNDLSMFEYFEESVAVENATEDIRKKAKYQTASSLDEGVAKYLERLLKEI